VKYFCGLELWNIIHHDRLNYFNIASARIFWKTFNMHFIAHEPKAPASKIKQN